MSKKAMYNGLDFVLSLLKEHDFVALSTESEAIDKIQQSFSLDESLVLEKLFYTFYNWLSDFTDKLKAINLFVQFINKLQNKERFIDLFLDLAFARESLVYIFSYPYLYALLLEDADSIFFVFREDFVKKVQDAKDSSYKKSKLFYEREYLLKDLLLYLGVDSESQAMKIFGFKMLLRFKKIHILRIACLKCTAFYDVADIGSSFSHLADFIISLVLQKERALLEKRMGEYDVDFAIIALGNYALCSISYTDSYSVLFTHESRESSRKEKSQKKHSSAYDFTKVLLCSIIDFISPRQGEALYKLSFYSQSKRSYYPILYTSTQYIEHIENKHTILDRYSLANLRLSAGNKELAYKFIKLLSPVVYRKYLSVLEISELQGIISNIYKSFERKPLKTIDSILNLFCLLYTKEKQKTNGSSLKKLSLLCSFDKLLDIGLITKEEMTTIISSYHFFKELKYQRELFNLKDWSFFFEHLYKLTEKQVVLTSFKLDRANLHNAKEIKDRLGILFDKMIADAMTIFSNYIKVFADRKSYLLSLLYQKEYDGGGGLEGFLESNAFSQPRHAVALLKEMSPHSPSGKDNFANMLLLFFEIINKDKSFRLSIDMIFVHLSKAVQRYGVLDGLFELFASSPFLLSRLINMFSSSNFLSEILIKHTEFIEYLADEAFLDKDNSIKDLSILLDKFLRVMTFRESVVYLKAFEDIRIGMQYMLSLRGMHEIGVSLSNLAELILVRSFEHFHKQLSVKYSYDCLDYAIVFLGKLGAREMTFGSDMDIYVVYDEQADTPNISLFYGDIIEKLNDFLSSPSFIGAVYELDFRLRPEGRNSPITVSFNKMKDYLYANRELVWEKLVYTRARSFSPNSLFESKVERLIYDFVFYLGNLTENRVKKEVREMRGRIASNAFKKHGEGFLFKKGRGGMLDIEFFIEYLIIMYGKEISFFSLPLGSRNIFDVINILYREKVLPYSDYALLKDALFFFKDIECTIRINANLALQTLPNQNTKEFIKLSYKHNFNSIKEFTVHYSIFAKKVQGVFDVYFK